MKILNLGLDNSVLNQNSALAGRVVEYGELVEKYTIIVPSRENKTVDLSERVRAVGAGAVNKFFSVLSLYWNCRKLLKVESYNIITVQDQYYLGLVGLFLAKKHNLGLEIQVHGFEKYGGLRKIIARYILPRADAVRVVSRRLEKQLIDEFGIDARKITVVPVYIDINQKSKIKNQNDNSKCKDKFIFLTVGRLVTVKNIEMQIRAMKELKIKSEKLKVELWIVGDGPERENHELRIKNYELENNVKMFGWRDDLDKFYSQADAFLLTSNSEGWGMAVIEAASFGLPIIMTDVGCAGEVIKDGESGLVIPVGDQKALEESMIKLINDEQLRKKLGEGARQAVMNLPNKEETLKLYKKSWELAKIKL
jgi:glycosyltransferase involved in cell wall biosynthesis